MTVAYIEVCEQCGERLPTHSTGCARRRTITASRIAAEPVEWLWPGRVPFGMVTVFAGMPGVGKSTILYDLAARTTKNDRTALVVTAEDHLAAVVRPRLEAAGAVLSRVEVVTELPTLPDDVSRIAEDVQRFDAALVI